MQVEVLHHGSWHACRVLDALLLDGCCTVFYHEEGRVEPGVDISKRVRKAAKTDEEYLASRVRIAELEPDQQLRGCVVKIVPSYGAFIDVGAERDGLVHISRIHPGFINSIHDFVKLGQEVDVWVHEQKEDPRPGEEMLWLSMLKPLTREGNRDVGALADVPPDKWLKARVFRITCWGAWLDVMPPVMGAPVRGLLYRTDISGSYIEDIEEELEVGQWVTVRILQCEPEIGRMTLSMRPNDLLFRRSPPEDLFGWEEVPDSTWLPAVVVDTSSSGILVDVEPPWSSDPVCGLVPATQIREGDVKFPAQEVRVGQEVDVRVLGVDEDAGRLTVSMKGQWGDE